MLLRDPGLVARRLAGSVAVWTVLAEGALPLDLLSALTVVAATLASLALVPRARTRLHPVAAARFCAFFLLQSVRGGWDVARRALDPRLPLSPDFIEHPLRLKEDGARVLFVLTATLLPGTASVELKPQSLRLHVLDRRLPTGRVLAELERHVAAMLEGAGDLPSPTGRHEGEAGSPR